VKRFRKVLTVGPEDLDDLQHVNNLRYLEWVLQIAAEHWQELTKGRCDQKFIWVVRSHHIQYDRPALEGERLELETYVASVKGALSDRIVEIRSASTGKRTTLCRTEWCLILADSGKPTRIPVEMQDLLLGSEER
jgi:acyl-CoA thioester hydrolase